MSFLRVLALSVASGAVCLAATFGTSVPVVGGASDIVLDEARNRLYVVNSNRNQLEVYSIPQRRFLTPIPTEQFPLAAAISRSRKFLYVTAHTASALMVIDLDALATVNRVSLPARPEGVAVGADERVLISTVGTGQGNQFNVLIIYDPNASEANRSLTVVPVSPPPAQNPLLPPPAGRPFLTPRSQLRATDDGNWIVGINIPNNATRTVFLFEVASGTVLRSRTVNGVSSVLSISPDASRFMAGLVLFEAETLAVMAQQNAANAPYPFAQGTNFNVQQNQGGSVFTPDGSQLYSAFNFAPVQNPPARPNVSQLMVNDPENLLITAAYQMPESLAGKMVITSDGGTIFALSESGFLVLPVGTLRQNPLAAVESTTVLLANDQCEVTRDQRSIRVAVRNEGRGRLTANAALLQLAPTGPGGLGGAGGPGGGQPGGGVVIVLPPGGGDGGRLPEAPVLPGGQQTPQNAAVANAAPRVTARPDPEGSMLEFSFNPVAGRSLGTASPSHQFLVQSSEAINIPPTITVFQNNRDAEARGDLIPVPTGLSANEGLVDMVLDAARRRLYIANSGRNRIEVFDTRTREFQAPIKVGQLPRSLALAPDGNTLYVANSGGESISIVNLDRMEMSGRVRFPPTPFNANVALVTPSVIAAGLRGPLVVMNNGTLWRIIGNDAVPRGLSPLIGSLTVPAPRTMSATPNGEYILLLGGPNGFAYLYDSVADEFIQARQVVQPPITGYYGPVAAGPRGQYFLVNGEVLNQSLTPVASAGSVPGAGGPARPGFTPGTVPRPISAVAVAGATSFARFSQPFRQNANQALTEAGQVELVDIATGNTMRSAQSLEGPLSSPVGTQRANIDGRTLAVDSSGTVVYALTTSGLSIVPLEQATPAERPVMSPGGVVNTASYLPNLAQGGLVSIFGRNLAEPEMAASTPLPIRMGGACVTLNNRPLPLIMSSAGQINAQIPTDLAPGRYPLVIRALDRKAASQQQQVTVSRYAPAVFVDGSSGQAAIFHADGRPVTPSAPARRDRPLVLYASGLGVTRAAVPSGQAAPSEPLAVTANVEVFFGDPRWSQAEVIVDWSGLVPGYVALYQLNLRVPGDHLRGEKLPITLRIGGVNSPVTGPVVPVVAVD